MLRYVALACFSLVVVAQESIQLQLEGRVQGPGAKPIRGAMVALVPTSEVRDLAKLPLGRTSASGRFALAAAPGKVGLTVTAPGFLPHFRNLDLKVGVPLPPLEVNLEKGGYRVQGTVRPAKGCSLEGVRLGFPKVSQDAGDMFFAEVKRGRFDLTLAPGAYVIEAQGKNQTYGGQRFELRGDKAGLKVDLHLEPTAAKPEVLAWIRAKAIPLKTVEANKGFEDMQPLKALMGDARVVALGEATHGTKEFFQLKHRMLQFLVEEMGFTVFAIEANLPEAYALDEYIRTGQGDPAKALAGLGFWTWNTEEVLDMIRWMRIYNENPAHLKKLRFYGFDMQEKTVSFTEAKAWLDKIAAEEAIRLDSWNKRLTELSNTQGANPSKEALNAFLAIAQEIEALIQRLDDRRGDFGEGFERQRQNLRLLAQFATWQAEPRTEHKVRDASMAANVNWILAQNKGAKLALWAHNGHISFCPGARSGGNPMGWHLRQALGEKYRSMGFTFREGGFQALNMDPKDRGNLVAFDVKPQERGTLDGALAGASLPVFALDLRALPKQGPIRAWFDAPQGIWSIGSMFGTANAGHFLQSVPITGHHDALVFVNRTTAAVPVGGRRAKRGTPTETESIKAPLNLGFEETAPENSPLGWFAPVIQEYLAQSVPDEPKEGARCLKIARMDGPNSPDWYTVLQAVDATPYRGEKIRVAVWVRTDGQVGAGLWVRADTKNGQGRVQSSLKRPINSPTWVLAETEVSVAEDSTALTYGCLVGGRGTAWFDEIKIEAVP